MEIVQVIFIRHGMTAGNEEKRYIGRTDELLSEQGKKEIRDLLDAGILPKSDLIFSSPMKRCVETAGILYPGEKVRCVPDFREIDFGDFEGKNAEELLADPDSGYQKWIDSGGMMTFPHGEPRRAFITRCRQGFSEMMDVIRLSGSFSAGMSPTAEETSSDEMPAAVAIVHGGTIMAILSGLCGGDYYDYMCRPAEGFRVLLQRNGDGWTADKVEKIPAGKSRKTGI